MRSYESCMVPQKNFLLRMLHIEFIRNDSIYHACTHSIWYADANRHVPAHLVTRSCKDSSGAQSFLLKYGQLDEGLSWKLTETGWMNGTRSSAKM